MNRISHYSLICISLLYATLGLGLVGCSEDDEPEVYPAIVAPNFSGSVYIQPDSTLLFNGGVALQFYGGEDDNHRPGQSSPGCFGVSISEPRPVYEVGDAVNLCLATVTLNGFPLLQDNYGKYNLGIRYSMPEDSFLVLQEGDSLHLVYNVPNEDERPMKDVILHPEYYPYLPANHSTIGLDDTLALPNYDNYFSIVRNSEGQSAVRDVGSRQDEDGRWVIQYVLYEDETMVGDTLRVEVSWLEKLNFGISGLYYKQHFFLIVSE